MRDDYFFREFFSTDGDRLDIPRLAAGFAPVIGDQLVVESRDDEPQIFRVKDRKVIIKKLYQQNTGKFMGETRTTVRFICEPEVY